MNDTNTGAALRDMRSGSVPRSWRLALVLLLTVSWTRPAAGDDATPREPRGETGGQTLITVSRETTVFTEPLDDEGFPDLLAAIDAQLSRGVTPENNAAVPLVRAAGMDYWFSDEVRREVYRRLGMEPPNADEPSLLEFIEWLRLRRPELYAHETRRDRVLGMEFPARTRPWQAEIYPEVAAWLAEIGGELDAIVEGAERPRFYLPVISDERTSRLADSAFGHSGPVREAMWALKVRAMLRFGSGDTASALRDLEAIHRIARHLASEPFLISAINAYAMDSVASETAREVAAGGYIPLDNLIRYQTRLANLPPLPGMREKLAPGERLGFVELVCDIARNNYRSVAERLPEYEAELKRRAEVEEEEEDASLPLMGSADSYALLVKLGRIARFTSSWRHAVDWDAALRVGAEHFEAVDAALAHKTFDQRKRALQAVSEELEGLDAEFTGDFGLNADDEDRASVSRRIGEVLLSTHVEPNTPRAATNAEFRTRMQFELTRVALALAAYHAQHRAYPADLQAVVPDFFAAVPNDLFTGENLRYERRGDGYLLYSLGWNQRDDNATSDISGTVEGEWADWRAAEKLGGDDLVVRVPPRPWDWVPEQE